MDSKSEKGEKFKLEVKELSVETQKTGFIPEWFQLEFGKLLNEIIKMHVLEMNTKNQESEEVLKTEQHSEEEASNEEYVNWSKTSKKNNFRISGTIKYENKAKTAIQIYISRGESIKFSRTYTNEVEDIIDNLTEVFEQIKNFILVSCKVDENVSFSINSQQCLRDIIKLLEDNKEDDSPEKHFVTGLFLAKAGEEEKSLENLNYVIANSSNPEMIQDCYKTVLTVKAKKNMKDLESAQNEVYKGDPAKAVGLIESLIQITPEYLHLHFLLGTAYKKSGQVEKSMEAFKKALAIDPKHVPSFRELAEELVSIGNMDDAKNMYRKIIELGQANATDYYNLGMCLKRMGKPKELDEIIMKIKDLDTEGKLDSYIFNLFDMNSNHFKEEPNEEKKSFWSRLFGKK